MVFGRLPGGGKQLDEKSSNYLSQILDAGKIIGQLIENLIIGNDADGDVVPIGSRRRVSDFADGDEEFVKIAIAVG